MPRVGWPITQYFGALLYEKPTSYLQVIAIAAGAGFILSLPRAKFLDGDAVIYRHTGETLKLSSATELRALAADEIYRLANKLNEARLSGFLAKALREVQGVEAIRDAKDPA